VGAFGQYLAKGNAVELAQKLEAGETLNVELDGGVFEVGKDLVDLRITGKEGFAVGMENSTFTILDCTLTPDLIAEGYAREVVSKVQQLRKQNDFEMMDNINIYMCADDEIKAAVEKHKDYICSETLAKAVIAKDGLDEFDINGHKTGIAVERI